MVTSSIASPRPIPAGPGPVLQCNQANSASKDSRTPSLKTYATVRPQITFTRVDVPPPRPKLSVGSLRQCGDLGSQSRRVGAKMSGNCRGQATAVPRRAFHQHSAFASATFLHVSYQGS